jgi:uncharacterized protein (TIRG00374 family)
MDDLSGKTKTSRPHLIKRLGPWLLGLVIIIALLMVGDISQLKDLLYSDVRFLFLALLCTALHIWLTGQRWRLILETIHPFRDYPKGFFMRAVLTGLIGGLIATQDVGLAASRWIMLRRHTPISSQDVVFSITIDRLLDVLLNVVLGFISVFYLVGSLTLEQTTFWFMIAGLVLLGMACLPERINLVSILIMLYRRMFILVGRIPFVSRRFNFNQEIVLYHLPSSKLVLIVAQTLIRFLLLALRYYLLSLAFHFSAPFLLFLAATPLSLLSLVIGFFPGGFGLADVSLYAILISTGMMTASQTTNFVVGSRAFNILSLGILGLVERLWAKGNQGK